MGHQPVGHDRHLRAGMGDGRLAERDDVVGVGDVAADAIGTSSCARRRGPGRRRGSTERSRPRASYGVDGTTTLSPGTWVKNASTALRVVERPVDATAVRGPDRHRHAVAVVRAVAHPGRLGHELVERREDEVGELDLGHRAQAVDRGADRGPDDHRFGQRRVDDPRRRRTRPTGRRWPGTRRPSCRRPRRGR